MHVNETKENFGVDGSASETDVICVEILLHHLKTEYLLVVFIYCSLPTSGSNSSWNWWIMVCLPQDYLPPHLLLSLDPAGSLDRVRQGHLPQFPVQTVWVSAFIVIIVTEGSLAPTICTCISVSVQRCRAFHSCLI